MHSLRPSRREWAWAFRFADASLQREMNDSGISLPVIFLTGHGDIPMTVHALKAGAVHFLTKPVREDELMNAIRQALENDREARSGRAEIRKLRECFDLLSPRER